MEEELTLQEICQTEGAVSVLKRYSKHLGVHVRQAIINYESTDFNREAFLFDVTYALDNIKEITEAAAMITAVLEKMHAEVAPT